MWWDESATPNISGLLIVLLIILRISIENRKPLHHSACFCVFYLIITIYFDIIHKARLWTWTWIRSFLIHTQKSCCSLLRCAKSSNGIVQLATKSSGGIAASWNTVNPIFFALVTSCMKYSFQLGSNVFGLVVERSVTISEPLNKHVKISEAKWKRKQRKKKHIERSAAARANLLCNMCYHTRLIYHILMQFQKIWANLHSFHR